MMIVKIDPTFMSWRDKARQLLSKKIHYNDIEWTTEESGMFFGEFWQDIEVKEGPRVPREFMDLAISVSAFREESTWSLLYRSLYRLVFEENRLLDNPLDADVMELQARAKLVSRDIHKMKAFVRFKEVQSEEGTIFMAWHNPDHRIIRLAAPFFKDRFNGMKWIIMTNDETANWNGEELTFSEGVPKEKAPTFDDKEDLWKTYYKAIFNPARIKISAMKKELPVRHWKTLPETELITSLIQEAPDRLEEFYESQRKAPEVQYSTLTEMNSALAKCRACGICEKATAPVAGLGPVNPKMMIIGEQPGNEEDLQGKPFIGPAGGVLNDALKRVGLERTDMYLTNAVKGFKYLPKAHMRWHKGASISEITTCKSWLKKEIELVKPDTIVCLGRSAALSIVGKMVKIEDVRGRWFESAFAKNTIILPHPASILRDMNDKEKAFEDFVADWKKVSGNQ
jgi:uracil-DNA glycosylase